MGIVIQFFDGPDSGNSGTTAKYAAGNCLHGVCIYGVDFFYDLRDCDGVSKDLKLSSHLFTP